MSNIAWLCRPCSEGPAAKLRIAEFRVEPIHRRAFLSPMTHKERELLETIGRQVAGPRHKADVDAVPEVVALIESLIEQKLVESTDHVRRATTPFIRVCLTGKGWMRYKEGLDRKQAFMDA